MVLQPLEILLLSKGTFEGKHVRDTILAQPCKNHAFKITDVPLLLDGRNQSDVVKEVSEKIEGKSFHAVVIVLSLPVRATPEAQKHLSTIRKILGKTLATNGLLLFTNGSHMNRNPSQFQEFLDKEIESSKQDGFTYVSLGKLISSVPRNHCLLYDLNAQASYDRSHQNENLYNVAKTLSMFTYTRWSFRDVNKKPFVFLLAGLLVVLVLKYGFRVHSKMQNLQLDVIQQNETINHLVEERTQGKATIMQLRSDVNERNEQISNSGREIQQQKTILLNRERQLEESNSQLRYSKGLIEERSAKITHLEEDIKNKFDEIMRLNREIEDNRAQIKALLEQTEEQSEIINDLNNKINIADDSITQLKLIISNLKTANADLIAKVDDKDKEITFLKINKIRSESKVNELDTKVKEKDKEIENLQKKMTDGIGEKDSIIVQLEKRIKQMENEERCSSDLRQAVNHGTHSDTDEESCKKKPSWFSWGR